MANTTNPTTTGAIICCGAQSTEASHNPYLPWCGEVLDRACIQRRPSTRHSEGGSKTTQAQSDKPEQKKETQNSSKVPRHLSIFFVHGTPVSRPAVKGSSVMYIRAKLQRFSHLQYTRRVGTKIHTAVAEYS